MADDKDEKFALDVIRFVKDAGPGGISHRLISRKFKGKGDKLDKLFTELKTNGTLTETPVTRSGKKTQIYTYTADDEGEE